VVVGAERGQFFRPLSPSRAKPTVAERSSRPRKDALECCVYVTGKKKPRVIWTITEAVPVSLSGEIGKSGEREFTTNCARADGCARNRP
jgi:hypothetical protein